jgi:hypothetical protein
MSKLTYKCPTCKEEIEFTEFLDLEVMHGEEENQLVDFCPKCDSAQTLTFELKIKAIEPKEFSLSFEELKEFSVDPISDDEADFIYWRFDQIKFSDDVDEELKDLVKKYKQANRPEKEFLALQDYFKRKQDNE